MIGIPQRSTANSVVGVPYCRITMIKSALPSSWTRDLLSVFGESSAQICSVKVTHNKSKTVWMLLFNTHYLFSPSVRCASSTLASGGIYTHARINELWICTGP